MQPSLVRLLAFAWYPAFTLAMFAISLALIPRACIRRLFLTSLLWGFFASWLLAVSSTWLGAFRYQHAGPFSVAGSPIWLNLAWAPAIQVYLYFQPPMRQRIRFGAYWLIWGLMSGMLDNIFHKMGLLVYIHWSPYHRFFLALVLFFATSHFYRRIADTEPPVRESC